LVERLLRQATYFGEFQTDASQTCVVGDCIDRVTEQGFAHDPEYKGKGLQLELAVEDEGVFRTPWAATMTYRRPLSPLGQWPEVVCAENAGFDGGYTATVPTADKPDF
jgi:hypothetical protein